MLDGSHLVDFPSGALIGKRDGQTTRDGRGRRVALDNAAIRGKSFEGERERFDGWEGSL